jgi:hypothetical protein
MSSRPRCFWRHRGAAEVRETAVNASKGRVDATADHVGGESDLKGFED